MYIYLDESGDLGFDFTKPKTTKKFVISLLVCQSSDTARVFKRAINRTIKKKINRNKIKPARVVELKGTNSAFAVKQYFFRQIKTADWQIYTVILNKSRVKLELRTKKDKLYNFLARFIIDKLPLSNAATNTNLIVDRSKNKEEIKDFNRYIQDYIQGRLPLNTGFKVEHLTSQESAGLQAVDLFCWGIARKYEQRDTEWYEVFKEKIEVET